MARTYTASPLYQLVPRTRRISARKGRALRAAVSLWAGISRLSAAWASGTWGAWAPEV